MKLTSAIVFSLFVGVAAFSQEPSKPPLTPKIITATKQVTLFTALEKQMLQAVQKKDRVALEAMLSDDCSIAMPKADPLDCADWMDSVATHDFNLKSFAVRGMSVTDLGDSALVSFDRIQQATLAGKELNGEFFVLDLWRKSGNSWKLANRYVTRIEPAAPPTNTPKPSGKE